MWRGAAIYAGSHRFGTERSRSMHEVVRRRYSCGSSPLSPACHRFWSGKVDTPVRSRPSAGASAVAAVPRPEVGQLLGGPAGSTSAAGPRSTAGAGRYRAGSAGRPAAACSSPSPTPPGPGGPRAARSASASRQLIPDRLERLQQPGRRSGLGVGLPLTAPSSRATSRSPAAAVAVVLASRPRQATATQRATTGRPPGRRSPPARGAPGRRRRPRGRRRSA